MIHPHTHYCMVETFREIVDTRLPRGAAPRQLLAEGCRQALKRRANGHIQPLTQTVRHIRQALSQRERLSVVSLGDSEVFTLALGNGINLQQYHSYLRDAAIRNAGNTSQLFQDRDRLIEGLKRADIIGVPFMMHYEVQSLLIKVLSKVLSKTHLRNVAFTDSAIGYLLAAHGYLYRLLHLHSSPKILIVGNKAPELAQKLSHLNIASTVAPVNGLNNLKEVKEKIHRQSFDVALVAAGIASLPICGHIREQCRRVAIDIGKLPEMLLDGLFHWDRVKPSWELDPSKKHRLIPMTVWSHFIYKNYPEHVRIPLGHSPGELVRLGTRHHPSRIVSYKEFAKQLTSAYRERKAFSFISSPPVHLLHKRHLLQRTFVGLPLTINHLDGETAQSRKPLNKHPVRYVEDHALLFLSSQFYPFFQKFLLDTKPIPRVMLVLNEQTKQWESLLRASGVRLAGTLLVDPEEKVPRIVKRLETDFFDFDITLVAAGCKTPSICLLAAKKLNKIAIDSRKLAFLHEKSPVFKRIWQGIPHRSTERWRDLAGIRLYQKVKNRLN